MAEVLFELEQVLRSKKHVLTIQESNAIMNCKSKALKSYAFGAIFGAGVSWLATSKFSFFGRISVSAGVSACVGLWRLGNSLDSCIDNILAMEGSKMQLEMAKLVVTKYRHDPWRMRLISRHFYSEQVFDDSTSDKPKIRWRNRNYFSDNVDNGQKMHESESHGESHGVDDSETQTESDVPKFNPEAQQASTNTGVDTMDPLDCFFGYPAMEEIRNNDPNSAPTKVHSRKERRAHRRRRLRHQDVLLSPQAV